MTRCLSTCVDTFYYALKNEEQKLQTEQEKKKSWLSQLVWNTYTYIPRNESTSANQMGFKWFNSELE